MRAVYPSPFFPVIRMRGLARAYCSLKSGFDAAKNGGLLSYAVCATSKDVRVAECHNGVWVRLVAIGSLRAGLDRYA